MQNVVILLGSNIEKEQNFPKALDLLKKRVSVVQISALYESAAVGTVDQPSFWNAAVLIKWSGDALSLKSILQNIEKRLHRVRTADPNAARTIDLDITLFGGQTLTYAGRSLPDPELLEYPHIAVPTADVAGDWQHPITHEPIRAIAKRLLSAQPNALAKRENPAWQF